MATTTCNSPSLQAAIRAFRESRLGPGIGRKGAKTYGDLDDCRHAFDRCRVVGIDLYDFLRLWKFKPRLLRVEGPRFHPGPTLHPKWRSFFAQGGEEHVVHYVVQVGHVVLDPTIAQFGQRLDRGACYKLADLKKDWVHIRDWSRGLDHPLMSRGRRFLPRP